MRGLIDQIRPLYANPSFRQLLLLNALQGIASSFTAPFMSMFGTLEAKMSLFAFGAFMTISAISGIIIATVLAHVSDHRFARRSMLLVGGIAGALGYAGYAYFRGFVPLVLTGSLLLGVSSVTFSQLFAYARELLIRSNIEPAQSAFYINVFRMFIALAWTVGPALASWIMIRFSYRGLFLCAAADLLLFAYVVWRHVPDIAPPPPPARASGAPPLVRVLARSDVLAHFAAFILITAAMTICMMNLPLFIVKTLGGDETHVGVAYSVGPVFELPFMLYFGWLATRRAPAQIIGVGMTIMLAYYLSLLFVVRPQQVYACQALQAAAVAVVAGVAITYFQSHLPLHPGTATNLYVTAQRIGSTAGYFLFVGLAWRFGHRAVFEGCALFALLALGLMLVPVRAPALA